jgi:FAD/FMN-containing dehydrogenase
MSTPRPIGPSLLPVAGRHYEPDPARFVQDPSSRRAQSRLVPDLAEFRNSLDGELLSPESSGYEAIRCPANAAYRNVRPRLVVLCRSVSDVVGALTYAAATGDRIAPRGGGHCFAGRSSTDGIVLDLSGLDGISVADDRVATIGAGARLGQVYAALHTYGRTLPAGCGPTVGITGLTLGGGIGLLGRMHGLTCDRLVGAQVVLPDGRVVDCDHDHEPDLFWGLRGAGGGQFGVVTSLRFDTVPAPITTRIEAHWSDTAIEELVSAWQAWAPDARTDSPSTSRLCLSPARLSRPPSLAPLPLRRDRPGSCCRSSSTGRAWPPRPSCAPACLTTT